MSTLTIVFTLRLIVVIFISASAFKLWQISRIVRSPNLTEVSFKGFVIFGTFAFLRLIASFLDNRIGFEVGVFSNMVNNATYLLIFIMLCILCKTLKKTAVDEDGNNKVSMLIGEIIDEMKAARRALN